MRISRRITDKTLMDRIRSDDNRAKQIGNIDTLVQVRKEKWNNIISMAEPGA